MILRFLIFINFSEAALQPRGDCNDPDIYNQCSSNCDIVFLDCRQNCDNSDCSRECYDELDVCERSCPCGSDCPTGCADCPDHPLCPDECEDAQINNEEYKTCLNKAVDELDSCLKSCLPDIDCHNSCYARYTDQLLQCPCFENETTTTTTEASSVTTTTTELIPIEPSDVSILVITLELDKSYLQSGDGSSQVSATIDAPNNEYSNWYADEAAYALVHGNLHIFGGVYDGEKIARLDGCTLTELPARLNEERRFGHAALSITDGTEALICFGWQDCNLFTSCELFSGSTAVLSTFSTEWTHVYGGLALYKDQPTTIGCSYTKGAHNKTETLSSSGWTSLADHPLRISVHTLVGLENKSMLLLGGFIEDDQVHQTGIWQLRNDEWSKIGELLERASHGSALYIGRYIYLFAVHYDTFPIQRISMNKDEEIEKLEIIGYQPGRFYVPILFQMAFDYCV